MSNKKLVCALTIVIVLFALALMCGAVGCAKSPDIVDPPSGKGGPPVTSNKFNLIDDRVESIASKPAVMNSDGNGLGKNEALVYIQITKNGYPLVPLPTLHPVTYFVRMWQAVSGSSRTPAYSGTMDTQGRVVIRIKSSASISGYYRAELRIADTADDAIKVLGSWGSIPVNGGKSYDFKFPIDGQAIFLENPMTRADTKK